MSSSGQGKPEKFNFLGLTHICGKTRAGRFTVLRQTMRKRLQAKLGAVKAELRRRLHDRVPAVGKLLRAVVAGHFRYYGVPTNYAALALFRSQVERLWRRALSRRSQHPMRWERRAAFSTAGCPSPASIIPAPPRRHHLRQERMR